MPNWLVYLARRLVSAFVLLLILSMVTFLAFRAIPQQPAAFHDVAKLFRRVDQGPEGKLDKWRRGGPPTTR